jgi:hypothetical protein
VFSVPLWFVYWDNLFLGSPLAEFDAYTRFKAMVVTGNPEADLRILSKLDNLTE